MSNVVGLRKPDPPHLTGPAKCMACQHEWIAVAPVGVVVDLECPNCGIPKGIRKGLVSVPDGGELWTCNCGCDAFRVVGEGGKFKEMMCLNCGAPQDF